MSDNLKVLGQLDAAATTEEDLYAVPDTYVATCSSLMVCNRTAAQVSFRVSVAVAAATTDPKNYLFYDVPLAGNSTFAAVLGITLGQNDVIRTYASATGLSFNLFGVETY